MLGWHEVRKLLLHMTQNCSYHLLSPIGSPLIAHFPGAVHDPDRHAKLLGAMQVLRGQLYLTDGAIQVADLDSEGRFIMNGDEQAWHLLLIEATGEPIGCVRYLLHGQTAQYRNLRLSDSAIARHPQWGPQVRRAVESDLRNAQRQSLQYVEVGGWALAEKWRNTKAAFEMLVGSFALGALWGGCVGYCTATVRHSSSSILRRLGGESFTIDGHSIPSYEDPVYGCEMELLRFDYRNPAPRFAPLIRPLVATLAASPVISADGSERTPQTAFSDDLANLQTALSMPSGNSVPEEIAGSPFVQNGIASIRQLELV